MSNFIFQPPPGLGWSVIRRPKLPAIVQDTESGRGQLRVAKQSYPIWEYEMLWNYLKGSLTTRISTTQWMNEALVGFYLLMLGGYDTFLYEDPNDNSVTLEFIAIADGATVSFQLTRNIGSGIDVVQNINNDGTIPFQPYVHDFAGAKNLCMSSERFDQWGISGSNLITVTLNAGFSPDGSNSATKVSVQALNGANESELQMDLKTVPINGEQWTFSCYMRSDTPQQIVMRCVQSTSQNDLSFTCNVTTIWQRFVFTVTAASVGTGNFLYRIGLVGSVVNATLVYLFGAQAEISATATTYQQTGPFVNTVPWGPTPKYSFARTNALTFSEQLDNVAWTKEAGVTVTPNAVVAPDGNLTADQMTSGPGVGTYNVSGTNSVNGIPWTFSIWLRTASSTQSVILQIGRNGGFDIENTTVSVTPRWRRYTFSHSTTWTGTTGVYGLIRNVAAGSVYAWGAQLENAIPLFANLSSNAASPYIPTTTLAVTITDYTIGSTGIITFSQLPTTNAMVSWTGKFLYRLRFADDSIDVEEYMSQIHQVKKIKFESVIL